MRRTRQTNNNNKYMTQKKSEVVENSTYFTQQWLQPDVAKILQKSSMTNTEFDVHYSEKEWHEDGDLVLVRLTFRNCGRNLYTQRLVLFLIRTFYTK
jgi:hypothetical protein